MVENLAIIGGGLAGSEAAWQAAELGVHVDLYEMRPTKNTPAHVSDHLAELVCSNSLGSIHSNKAPGLLKAEMRGLGSIIIECAQKSALPAGSSLAVDREIFSDLVTEKILQHPNISLIRQEVTTIPEGPVIIATGPLTSDGLAAQIGRLSGQRYLYFYDALAPIVNYETVDMSVAFRASRYEDGVKREGDYLNCPMSKEEYEAFCEALVSAEQIKLRKFEQEDDQFFEGCLPVEVMAERSADALRYGPMRPVGLVDPVSEQRPYAVVQLRQDNLAGTLYNLVGFQTNLRWGEQKRVLRMIPGLQDAEFLRFGMMHRNTYINSPAILHPTMQYRSRANLLFAGQIVGAEGYVGNAATGLVAGINSALMLMGSQPLIFPTKTMIGSLCHYVSHAESKSFQPMKPNFGLLPFPESKMKKSDRYRYYSERALKSMRRFARENNLRYSRSLAESSGIGELPERLENQAASSGEGSQA
jgi:methylenetetrahydrofolate--tRNA-(uracil-5-)-methyltransferase